MITLRFRGKDGTYRIQIDPEEPIEHLALKLSERFHNNDNTDTILISRESPNSGFFTLGDLGGHVKDHSFNHGDLYFIKYGDKWEESRPATSEPAAQSSPGMKKQSESSVDKLLEKSDGKIYRGRSSMCRHGPRGMCDYCMPLEPYDASYLAEHNIKYLSFHSYLRKLDSVTNKAGALSSYVAPLEEPDYTVKTPCPSGHAPYPEGICTKCQPATISLQQQSFRMVDHIEFSDPSMVDRFLSFWRRSGTQRIGYMYGTYKPYDDVPLGVKAVIEVIYEPPQTSEVDGITLNLPWADEVLVQRVASLCGMEFLGIIFTDLTDDKTGKGTVLCKRHKQSYFLSSLEICLAARLQQLYPTFTKHSESGKFGSRVITCVISGNLDGAIEIAAYQVSNSCVAMYNASIIDPSVDPTKMLIKNETATQYIPEVFYRRINEYGATVSQNAKPAFPVEYLLTTLTHGFPSTKTPLFSNMSSGFCIENRETLGEVQTLKHLGEQLGLAGGERSSTNLETVSDFHLLLYVSSLGILEPDDEKMLCEVALRQDLTMASTFVKRTGWQTLLTILRNS